MVLIVRFRHLYQFFLQNAAIIDILIRSGRIQISVSQVYGYRVWDSDIEYIGSFHSFKVYFNLVDKLRRIECVGAAIRPVIVEL